MSELFDNPESFGSNIKWWIGIVAPRSAWAGSGTLINDKSWSKQTTLN